MREGRVHAGGCVSALWLSTHGCSAGCHSTAIRTSTVTFGGGASCAGAARQGMGWFSCRLHRHFCHPLHHRDVHGRCKEEQELQGWRACRRACERLELKPVPSGANVNLITPYDDGVLHGAETKGNARVTSPVQTCLDLRQIKGRGEAPADLLKQQATQPSWPHPSSPPHRPVSNGW
jgi:hypothetical protein